MPIPFSLSRRRSRRSCSAARSRPASARSTTCSTSVRGWQLLGQIALALFAVALGISIDFIAQPVRRRRHPLLRAGRGGSHGLLDRRDDQQHQLDRRPRRPVVRRRVHRRGDARAHQPDDAGHRGGQPLIAVLCFALAGALLGFLRWNFHPASIFAGTSGVQFVGLHARRAGHPRVGQGRGRAARARRADHRHVLDHRPAGRPGTLAVHPGPEPHPPPAARSRAVAPPDRARRSTASASRSRSSRCSCRGSPSCTRSSGIFVAFGLVLFLPTRGDFDRPDELEADAYEPEVPSE